VAATFRGGRHALFLGMAKQHLFLRIRQLVLASGVLGLIVWVGTGFRAQPATPTQAQVAYRFLKEVLRDDYPTAYRRLAPEVQRALSSSAFVTAAQPLQQLGQQRGPEIKLYKLGTRLGGRGKPGQWFYSFSFTKDSLLKPSPVLLEVTFRDTTARQVLGFGVRKR
jgi:hypothetical protein